MIKDVTPTGNENELVSVAKNDIMSDVAAYKQELRQLPEVKNLTSEIDISNGNSILAFGQKPSQGISSMSDRLLASMQRVSSEEASQMLVQLTKIMDKFDIKELEDPEKLAKQGLLKKLFTKIQNSVDDLFAKYDDMGKEVDKVYQILHKYEHDIDTANTDLELMYNQNIQFYKELEKYIVAGEIAQEEIDAYKNSIQAATNMSEQEKVMQLQKLDMAKDMLSQRTYDLQIAENVAMQTVPMIQSMQMNNFNLKRKINSSFIITLPIFKQALIQAIQLKRQQIQSQSLAQLDAKTNELLLRNAQNTATSSVAIAKQAGTSSIQLETLQSTFQTIMSGIEETKRINSELAQQRKDNSVELERMKLSMQKENFTALPSSSPVK